MGQLVSGLSGQLLFWASSSSSAAATAISPKREMEQSGCLIKALPDLESCLRLSPYIGAGFSTVRLAPV